VPRITIGSVISANFNYALRHGHNVSQ